MSKYFIDNKNRIFLIQDDITSEVISEINFNLLTLIKEDDLIDEKEKNYKRKPIHIYINSKGGYIYDMWSLISIIENSKTPIHTYTTGYAFSAAFKIFLAGHKRFVSKNSILMYHQICGCSLGGKYQDVIDDIDVLNKTMEHIEEYVASKTKWTKEFLEEIRKNKKDYYIFGDEAIEQGIADEVL